MALARVLAISKKMVSKSAPKQILKAVGAISNSTRLTTKSKIADNVTKNLSNLKDLQAMFLRDKFTTTLARTIDDGGTVMAKGIRNGNFAGPDSLKRIIKSKLPFYHHSKLIAKTDKIAKKLNFSDETDFHNFVESIDTSKAIPIERMRKLEKVFQYLKNHRSAVAKLAVAGGTMTALVHFLKKFQAEHTGCFRYSKDDANNLIRYKFNGNFCLGSPTSNETDDIKLLPLTDHPLSEISKWNCDYTGFNDRHIPKIDEILNLGCMGLCNWLNFNTLTEYTTGFNPLEVGEEAAFLFQCEKATVLRALTTSVADVIDDTLTGFSQSRLAKRVFNLFRQKITQILVILCVFFLAFYLAKYQNDIKKAIYNVDRTTDV